MIPKAITSVLAAAQVLFLPIDGQPSDDDLVHLSDAILPILLKATYDRINGIHNLWGLVASVDCYLYHYGASFVRPATCPACYNLATTAEASRVDRVCAKTAWVALIQDYKAYKALSAASRSSSRLLQMTLGFGTFAIPRHFSPTLQPLTSSTI
jgi:hypothetical protein